MSRKRLRLIKSKRIWRTVRFDDSIPTPVRVSLRTKRGITLPNMDGHDLQYKTRWGWAIAAVGNWDKIPCSGKKGPLLRKHLYRSNGKCRRCGLMKVDEKNYDKVLTKEKS